ncbi:MAG: hypothetical protein BRC31_03715 [Actinobacteria bacterium QS_5_72_10]|nr:MAG: hypothetical protein BRC31_03715 [Actinobacteria bacterium QS_5_72_10]
MQVDVVSAERELFSGEATAVFARSVLGEIGLLRGHQPAVLGLRTPRATSCISPSTTGSWSAAATS